MKLSEQQVHSRPCSQSTGVRGLVSIACAICGTKAGPRPSQLAPARGKTRNGVCKLLFRLRKVAAPGGRRFTVRRAPVDSLALRPANRQVGNRCSVQNSRCQAPIVAGSDSRCPARFDHWFDARNALSQLRFDRGSEGSATSTAPFPQA